jgi:hypothetical protein
MEKHIHREPVYTEVLRDYQQAAKRFQEEPSIGAQAFWEVRFAQLEEALQRPGKFELGSIVWTPAAADVMHRGYHVPQEFLIRHVNGDFGDLDPHDRWVNLQSIEERGRVLSSYQTSRQERLWIITDANWQVTTLLRPQDY